MATNIEKSFTITGMSCAACSAAVERVTRKIEGVSQSDVNLTTNTMRIVFDENIVTDKLIQEKVNKAGFGCESAQTKKAEKSTLEKKVSSSEKQNLIVAWIFGILLMYVAMGHMMSLPLPSIIDGMKNPFNFALTQLLLTIPIMFIARGIYTRGFKAMLHLNPNMDSLVAMGSTVAFIYSLYLTYGISSNVHAIHDLYYEAAGIVVVFIMTGKFLESRSKEKTKSAITALMSLTPDTAFYVKNYDTKDEIIEEKALADIRVADVVLVKPGERIPLDGEVVKGFGGVDESMLTGESLPIEKKIGDTVIGGSINGNGRLYVKITRIGEDTTLAKIIKFVEEAQGKKAPIAKIADKVSGVFVPSAMGIALIAGIVWAIAGADTSFVIRVVTSILVIACPCALGLATPAAIMTGTGLGAANGILIRSGEALEIAKGVTAVVLDKTGTVTEGKPSVKNVFVQDNGEWTKEKLVSLTKAIEDSSSHPLAQAFESEKNDNTILVKEFENIAGKGVRATTEVNGKKTEVLLGSKRLMDENNIDASSFSEFAEDESSTGASLIFVSVSKKLIGFISIADTIKPNALEAITKFKSMGLKTVLLTGDNKKTAEFIAHKIGVDSVIAEVLPEDKAREVQKLQSAGEKVMMIGDGINDAPALVQADVGGAIGNGSDIAIESGDIVLVKGNIVDAARAIHLSRLTIANIKQNLFWAFCYNTIGIPIAAGVLYPVFGILLTPMFASLAMSLSSISVVGNALRLRTKKL